jgi:DNA repair protein
MLTDEQKAKIEENRKRALALRAQKLQEQQQREEQEKLAAAATASSGSEALQELLAQGGFTKEDNDDDDEEESQGAGAAQAASLPVQPPKPPQLAGKGGVSCEVCGSGLVDPTFQEVFGILVCSPCKSNDEEEFGLMTKGDAVAEFLLQEGTIRVMPFLERSNPRNTKYTKMKLYCRKQLRAKAYERWEGPEGLEEEMDRRKKRRYESALERTVNIFDTQKKKKWAPP